MKLKLSVLLLIYLISEYTCKQLIEYSNNNKALNILESKAPGTSTVAIVSDKPLRKRRKRLRRRRKKILKIEHTTLTPIMSFEISTKSIFNETTAKPKRNKKRQRKLKKQRNNLKRPNTIRNHKKLESRNLILPIIPDHSPSFTYQASTRPTQKKRKTRCSKANGNCAHICNTRGIGKCQCFKGFSLAYDGHSCIDTNECLTDNGGCQMNCTNTIGSHRCHCPSGLRLNHLDSRTCEDVNECLLRNGHGPCQDVCENIHGGYKCSCRRLKGSKLSNDLHSCVDVDECANENGGCSHMCINTFGKFFCSCPEGMELGPDNKNCKDINECESESIQKICPHGCINAEGSYRCASVFELQNDEAFKEIVCKPLFPPENGYFKCSRKHSLKTFAKSGRKTVRNSVGAKCVLVCPEGFKRKGVRFRASCGFDGKWMGNMDAECVPV